MSGQIVPNWYLSNDGCSTSSIHPPIVDSKIFPNVGISEIGRRSSWSGRGWLTFGHSTDAGCQAGTVTGWLQQWSAGRHAQPTWCTVRSRCWTHQHGSSISWNALCFVCTSCLVIPSFTLSTIGSRTFNISASQIRNALPEDIVSAPSLSIFQRRLNDLKPSSFSNHILILSVHCHLAL